MSVSEAAIRSQVDALSANLGSYGFVYVNVDDGWYDGCDEHGQLRPDVTKFPSGMRALAAYVHDRGLKLGLYLTPGLSMDAWRANGTVAGTPIRLRDIVDVTRLGNMRGDAYRIDFSKPGATLYIQGYANLIASWGVDYVKMDFVGSGVGNDWSDNRPDVAQWSAALDKTGRPIWLDVAHNLSFERAEFWSAHSNSWRIDGDIEDYLDSGALTKWSKVEQRFADAPRWAPYAGLGGWTNLDSLEIGNGDRDGLTPDERRTAMTLWAISCSPLILGADLTHLEEGDLDLLTNSEVLAVDEGLYAASPLARRSEQQVWRSGNRDGSFTVALFNLGATQAEASVQWSELGLTGSVLLRDLWERSELGEFPEGYRAVLAPHACQLLRATPRHASGKG